MNTTMHDICTTEKINFVAVCTIGANLCYVEPCLELIVIGICQPRTSRTFSFKVAALVYYSTKPRFYSIT